MASVLLNDAQIIDGFTDAPSTGFVLVEAGRINDVGEGTASPDALEQADLVFDCRGKTVLPGLVNAHEHLEDHRTFGSFQERMGRPHEMLLLGAVQTCLSALSEGITTIRDCGGVARDSVYLKHAVEAGLLIGPRISACIAPLGRIGGYGSPLALEASGAADFRRRAQELLASGADFLKCIATGGLASANLDGARERLELQDEELTAVADEAHAEGRRVTVHAHTPAGIRQAARCGVDIIEHGLLIDAESARLMADRGMFLVSTLSEPAVLASDGLSFRRPRRQVEGAMPLQRQVLSNFQHAMDAGVQIAMGLDVLGNMTMELQLMIDAGMTPMGAIQSATRVGAEVLGLDSEIGTIERGKVADLVVLPDDPLEDIHALANPEHVLIHGEVLPVDGIRAVTGAQLRGYAVDHGRLLAAEEYV